MAPMAAGKTIRSATFANSLIQTWLRRDLFSSPSLDKRADDDDDSSSGSKPVSQFNKRTLPIILAVVIPVTVALVIFLILHRRHVRRLRSEDAQDKTKSLDFGLGEVAPNASRKDHQKAGHKDMPEMTFAETEKTLRHERGVSMELDVDHPYMLPTPFHQSKESVHSSSYSMVKDYDKYRPATNFVPGGTSAAEHPRPTRIDSAQPAFLVNDNDSKRSLLHNAQSISRSHPSTRPTSFTSSGTSAAPLASNLSAFPPAGTAPGSSQIEGDQGSSAMTLQEPAPNIGRGDGGENSVHDALRKSDNYLGAFIQRGDEAPVTTSQPAGKSENPFPPRSSQPEAERSEPSQVNFPAYEEYVPDEQTYPPPHAAPHHPDSGIAIAPADEDAYETYSLHAEMTPGQDMRRLTMGFRPLPPDDPSEDPEQRANRIRSFYKEYFDESKQGPLVGEARPWEAGDAGDGHLYYGEIEGQFMARRAMTPPASRAAWEARFPRGMPSSKSGARSLHDGGGAYSLTSGRGRRGPARKHLPPPSPLPMLPTPHLLKDDTNIPMDFAPPSSFRERRAGTPDSLRGGLRPYSPTVPAHLPLASSFDDLTAMPSPHALRKSGVYSALEFAPPPRLRANTDGVSDAGSIRSNGSAMSAAQLHSIRAGAYRVSRIPQDLGGTKQELNGTLKPQWNMRQ